MYIYRDINNKIYLNNNEIILDISYEAESEALFARMDIQPTIELKILINKTIKDLKSGGLWDKLEVMYIMNMPDAQSSTLNWKGNQYNLTAVNSPVFSKYKGWLGSSTSYLRSGWINSNSTLATIGNTHTSFQSFQVPTAAGQYMFGAYSDILGKNYFLRYGNGDHRYFLYANNSNIDQDIQINNFYTYTSSGTTSVNSFRNAVNKKTKNYTQSSRPNNEMILCGFNNLGTMSGSVTSFANWMTGSALTDNDVNTLYTIIDYFNTNVYNLLSLGSELILNGGFDDNSNWVIVGGWSISGGTVNWLGGSTTTRLYNGPSNVITNGKKYMVTFDISNLTGTPRLLISNVVGNASPNVPYNTYQPVYNGKNRWMITNGITTLDHLALWSATTYAGTFSLDNFSVKEIL